MYLEHYLDSIENLPYELQRNFTLMRDLDQRTQDILKEIDDMADNYTECARNLSPSEKTEQLTKIEESFAKAKELSEDKVQLAMQTYEMVDKHIRKLDFDLARFEADLKEQHEQELAASDEENKDSKSRKKKRKKSRGKSTGAESARKKKRSDEPVIPPLAAVTAFLPSPDVQVLDMPVDPNEPTYCLCHQVSYGEMIGCDNLECPIEWFHFPCVGLTTKPKGKWYCPKCNIEKKKK
ncbi:inhibitor of growth protein 4-like isoform X1 [Xenia sp. Carnegie-2017]|uniref:inhibitor of growth protein 4-like isoform X1 n=1 Tax=Xenia sp. Carnegie-2017 TaxID=2897299 RepID=UPI001F0357E3|nr:inhibitor of growth protein 4-like isoform X1 [Xenia sp. Carnegie-2017]XP_046850307.1 inhibitor of growth protein 4-like isoform X1 [Xenia sp. Carnegie-2017]